jgi:Domain of unknown function (DUF5655)
MSGLGELVSNRPPEVASLFQRVLGVVERFDDVRVEILPKQVVLHGRNRIFGSARPTRHGVNVHLNLPYRVEDRRVIRSEPLTKKLTFHRFILSSSADFDDQFEGWINEAHDAARRASP